MVQAMNLNLQSKQILHISKSQTTEYDNFPLQPTLNNITNTINTKFSEIGSNKKDIQVSVCLNIKSQKIIFSYWELGDRKQFIEQLLHSLSSKQFFSRAMFPISMKDIFEQRPVSESPLSIRSLKPKLITTLNYHQDYFLRKKQKRRNRRLQKRPTIDHRDQTNGMFYKTGEEIELKKRNFIGSTIYDSNLYRQVYDGNDKILGRWINGLLDGDAQIEYQNGDFFRQSMSQYVFRGRFQRGYKIQGLMIFKDQGSYDGQFLNQQFHGRGVLSLKDKVISAEWVNGLIEGNCVIQYKNKNVYYGSVKQFKKHGFGYLYFPNDTKFFGQFVDGAIMGYGEYYEMGVLKSKGFWKNGQLIKQKTSQDGLYNYQEETVNWELMDNFFKTGHTNQARANSMMEIFLTNTRSLPKEEDEQFKLMLESLKNVTKNNHLKTNKLPLSQITADVQEESFEQ